LQVDRHLARQAHFINVKRATAARNHLARCELIAQQCLMSGRPFPPPWTIEELDDACFVVSDKNGQKFAYVYLYGCAVLTFLGETQSCRHARC